MLRTDTQHALRALVSLAQQTGMTVLGDIAGRSQVPAPMLAKVLHRLVQGGLVQGQPGPRGGYRLARPAEQIRLRDVTTLMEGPSFGDFCLFGLPACSDETPCPMHEFWGEIRRQVRAVLDQHTIADLAAGRLSIPMATDPLAGRRRESSDAGSRKEPSAVAGNARRRHRQRQGS